MNVNIKIRFRTRVLFSFVTILKYKSIMIHFAIFIFGRNSMRFTLIVEKFSVILQNSFVVEFSANRCQSEKGALFRPNGEEKKWPNWFKHRLPKIYY